MDGKELLVKTDPLNNWQLVKEEETLLNESIQSQDEKVTIFDLTGLKVELDDDYFFDENEGENNFEDDSSSLATTDYQTEQEVDPMAWHPVVKKDYQSYPGIYNSYTVKLGNKERFDKEQIGIKELFMGYQPFYTINLLLDKELLPI